MPVIRSRSRFDGTNWNEIARAGGSSSAALLPAEIVLVERGGGFTSSGVGVGSWLFVPSGGVRIAPGNASTNAAIFGFDPADYAVSGKTLQISVVGSVWTNNAYPASLSVSLYPVATNPTPGNITLGTVVATAVVHAAGGAAATVSRARTSKVNAPAAGGLCARS
jgi:hypothetical protein